MQDSIAAGATKQASLANKAGSPQNWKGIVAWSGSRRRWPV